MRVVLAILLILGVAALAWVTFSGGGAEGPEPVEPRPEDESGTGVRETVRTESDSPVRPVPEEPREEIPAYPWVEPEWKTAMADALSREKLTLDLKDADLETVLTALSGQLIWHVSAPAIPAPGRKFEMSYADTDAMRVLRNLASVLGAKVCLRPSGIEFIPFGVEPDWGDDEIYLAGLERARAVLDAGGPKAAPVAKLLPVGFDGVVLRKILPDIGNRLGISVEIDPRVTLEQRMTRVTLRTETMTAARVLDDVTAAARLTWAAEERRILVTFDDRARAIRGERERAKANAATEVELAVKGRPLAFVAEEIRRQVGVPVVVDRELWEPNHPRITLRTGPEPLGKLLRKLAKAIPARFLIRGEAIYLIPPAGR
ncbi:MAG: hypothetical protein ABFS86_15350 [Planctomycetota bacterium]